MSIRSFQPLRKGKGFPKYSGFHTFADSSFPISPNASFRDNIRIALHQFAELEENLVNGHRIWCSFLVHEGGGFVVPLYTIEELVKSSSPESFCDHCRCAGWSHHFVSNRKYHFIIPSYEEWNKPPSSDVLDLDSHLLHGSIHCNGFGHLLCINGIEGESKQLCGREIMDLWDRICSCLHTRKTTAPVVSKKHKMLRHNMAYGHPWCERWGYHCLCGSFGVKDCHYNRSLELLSSLELDKIIQDLSCTERCKDVKHIIRCYRDLSETNLITLRDEARSVTRVVTQSFGEKNSGKFCKFSGLSVNGDSQWPVKRPEFTANVIVEAVKLMQAQNKFSSSLMVKEELHNAAHQQIGDNGLIDCVLKSLNNVVVGDYIVNCMVIKSMPQLDYMIEEVNMCRGECSTAAATVTKEMVAEELIVGFPPYESELLSINDSNLLFKVLRPATSAVGQEFWESKISLPEVSLQEQVELPLWAVLLVTGTLLIIVLYNAIQIGAQLLQSFKRKGSKKIGKVTVNMKEKIGAGSHGSQVFKGFYEEREVAIKVVLRSHYEVVLREIDNLVALDSHPNVVRYFGREVDRKFYYISLERGACTLGDLVMAEAKAASDGRPLEIARLILKQMRSRNTPLWNRAKGPRRANYPTFHLIMHLRSILGGLKYLHDEGFVHGDISPHNILMMGVKNPCLKLSDMGLTKKECSKGILGGSGGWIAPETLSQQQVTSASDVHNFAAVAYYCISVGEHPYGKTEEQRQEKMKDREEADLSKVINFPDLFDVLNGMLKAEPAERPNTTSAIQHPFFWPADTRLDFLSLTSDWLQKEPQVVSIIESKATIILGKLNPWTMKGGIPAFAVTDLSKRGAHYNFKTVQGLLRLIRNLKHHYLDMSKKSKKHFGDLVYGVEAYFRKKFPHLLMEVYKVVEPRWGTVDCFKHFRDKLQT
ncbi:OLC1v1010390C1 [Oldenlandia corymbosa var. corymbosa]|uniref:non-specific serine/threonine protein kinase n=1 Tax=Oldenlandia corymbosa var. corymbosa TaxID=529605 RepID=A0AAV1DR76_OLDCO|nr:OLC1v1010390C1 [Oldenlandia corymbosa var. corymbosa]